MLLGFKPTSVWPLNPHLVLLRVPPLEQGQGVTSGWAPGIHSTLCWQQAEDLGVLLENQEAGLLVLVIRELEREVCSHDGEIRTAGSELGQEGPRLGLEKRI